MNILALYSSPRKKSNSSFLLDTILAEAKEKHEIKSFHVAKMQILPCKGCNSCFNNEAGTCVQKDDYSTVAEAIAEADCIFMATPLYWWGVSAQLKLVIDRLYGPSYTWLKGKTIYLVVTGYSPVEDAGYRIVRETFTEICNFIGARLEAFFVSADDETHPARENQEAIAEARRRGQAL